MSSVWQRFRRLIRDLGLPTAFLYLLQRLLGRAGGVFDLHYYRFLTQALQDAPRLSPGRGNPYSFRPLKKLDPALGGFDRSAAVIEARFA